MAKWASGFFRAGRVAGVALFALAGFLPLATEAQWIFVARHAIGRVEQVTQQQDASAGQTTPQQVTQVASVMLNVPAQRVFQVATNATNSNQNVTVVSNDPASMTIKLNEADQSATLKVSELSKNVSELMIEGTAPAGENPQTTRIVNAVLRLCGDLGKTCQVGN